MTSLTDLQQVRHIIEILRSGKVLLPIDSIIGKASMGDCSCRPDRFVYFAVVLDVALQHTSALASACCHYSHDYRLAGADSELLAHKVAQSYKILPGIYCRIRTPR